MKKIFLSLLILFITLSPLQAAKDDITFLLKADDSTSFMNFEYHSLAHEAAIKQQYDESFRLYQKIANKGDDRAEYNIGMMYMKGLGVARKKMNAYKWLRRASKHGNKEAIAFFKQMNERYDKKSRKKSAQKPIKKEISTKPIPVEIEPVIVEQVSVPEPIALTTQKPKFKQEKQESSLLYIILGFVGFVIIAGILFLKKGGKKEDSGNTKIAPGVAKSKSQMYDIIYEDLDEYHTQLLKQVDITHYRDIHKKMQAYYMFLAGAIDYFSQLQKFSEIEQRRIFNTHMGKIEGKENLTAITQAILEGQRDHSMYHFQAAGGISAKEWRDTKSKEALNMLKKLLSDEEA